MVTVECPNCGQTGYGINLEGSTTTKNMNVDRVCYGIFGVVLHDFKDL